MWLWANKPQDHGSTIGCLRAKNFNLLTLPHCPQLAYQCISAGMIAPINLVTNNLFNLVTT